MAREALERGAGIDRLLWRRLGVLWLAGFGMRVTVLAVPPLLPQIRPAFGLTEAGVSVLTTLPVLLLALGAPLGAAITRRVGPLRTVLVGLLVIAASSPLRTLGTGLPELFGSTFIMGIAIASIQPAMPTLVRTWAAARAGFATATYVNGLLVGEVLAASLTLTVAVPLTGGWRTALLMWSAPLLVTAILLGTIRGGGYSRDAAGGWWPDWRSPRTWQLGLLQGAGAAAYFAANAFLPGFLHATGRPNLVGPCLTALNGAQLPASVILAITPRHALAGGRLVAAAGTAIAIAGILIVVGHPVTLVVGAAIVGFTSATTLIVSLTIPATLGAAADTARVSAGMFTIGYTLAFLLPLVGGVAVDATGRPATAFIPLFVSALALAALAPAFARARRRRTPSGHA